MSKFKNAIGFPRQEYVMDVLRRFKIVLWMYGFMVLVYIIIFILLKHFGGMQPNSFGESFSASLLEDLIFFFFVGFVATIVSVIASAKTPEDFDFERRVVSIANSDAALENPEIRSFLVSSLHNTLIYYSRFVCEITIKKYNPKKNVYLVFIGREQVATNMCNDRQYIQPNTSIMVETDIDVDGSFGRFDYCETFDPVTNKIIHQDCTVASEIILQQGLNTRVLPLLVEKNSATGLRFGYNSWQQTGDISDRSNSIYFQPSRLSMGIVVKIKNMLDTKETLNFELQHFRSQENLKVPFTSGFLDYNSPVEINDANFRLLPGDALQCHISRKA